MTQASGPIFPLSMSIVSRVFVLLIGFFLAQCASLPSTMHRSTDRGLWNGKVLMLKEQSRDRKWANVTWISEAEKQRMRIDVYAFMDIPLATFLKAEGLYHLWIFTEKKYYKSSDGQKLFAHLTRMDINPDLFFSLLGRGDLPASSWDCEVHGSINVCHSKVKKMKMDVNLSSTDERQISLQTGEREFRLRLNRSKVELKEEFFQPLSSSHFKTIQL